MTRCLHFLLTTYLLFVSHFHPAKAHKKCCGPDSYLNNLNGFYFCDKDENKRIQVALTHTNYLDENIEGEDYCFDIDEHGVNKYTINNQTVIEETPVDVNFYHKCCPLNYHYNTVKHSCVPRDNMDVSFISQNFVKVGLPNCTLIIDVKLKSPHDYMIETDSLYLNGYHEKFREGTYCVDKDQNSQFVVRKCIVHHSKMACDRMKCVHKCCPDGQSFVDGKKCRNTYVHGLDMQFSSRINNSQDPFAIIHNYHCRIYMLKESQSYYLDGDGVFYAYHNNTLSYKPYRFDEKSYCIEHVIKDKISGFKFFMCLPDDPLPAKFVICRWVKPVSCVFLVFTIGIYLFLPEMMNLFGKILISYCFSVLAVFIMLTYSQFIVDPSDSTCVVLSFLSHFTSLCAFTWLNVMCFDIWWTFGSPKTFFTAQQRQREIRKFGLYSLYGWGTALLLTLILLACFYESEDIPYAIRPYIGTYKCFWDNRTGNYARFLFYVFPLIIINTVNIVLFVKTTMYCIRVKNEISRMSDNRLAVKERNKSINSDKEQLVLVVKLGVTMGISFTFEVVSSLYDFKRNPVTKYIEVVWDIINCLQGVFIFIIFICKRKVFILCRNKIMGERARKISTASVTTALSIPLTSKKSKVGNV